MLFWPSKFGKKTAHIRLLGLGAVVDHSGGRPRLPACLPVVEVLPDLCEPEDRAVGHPGGPELQVVCSLFHCLQLPFAHRARSTQFLLSLSLEPTLALSEVLGPVTTLSHRSVSRFLSPIPTDSLSTRKEPSQLSTGAHLESIAVIGRQQRESCAFDQPPVLISACLPALSPRLAAPKDSAARSEPQSPAILTERRPTTKHTTHVDRPSS